MIQTEMSTAAPPNWQHLVAPSAAFPTLDPMTQAFLDQIAERNEPPLHCLSFDEARERLVGIQSGPCPKPPASITELTLPVGPTGSVDVAIIRPVKSDTTALPVLIYCHGGGWVTGDRRTHDRLVRELAVNAHLAVVFIEYTRAPGVQFPIQNEQAYAAMCHVVAHATSLQLDATRVAIGGDGAGGAMAVALAMMARAKSGPEVAFLLLLYPMLAELARKGSGATFADGPWITHDHVQGLVDAEFAIDAPRGAAFPLAAPVHELEDLPPALIITAENDLLRDQGEDFGRRLMQAGVPVTATRYLGTIHDFMMLNALAETPPNRAALAQACAALRSCWQTA